MDCNEFEAHIAEYLDGMHDDTVRCAMEAHCTSCPECARLLALHKHIIASLDSAEPVKAPPELAGRILAAAVEEASRAHERALSPWASISAVAVFAFVTGLLFRMESFITTGSWDMGKGLISNGTHVFEWPFLIRAWLIGLSGSAWVQKLMEPVYLSIFSRSIPLYGIIGYGVFIGLLVWYAVPCVRSTARTKVEGSTHTYRNRM